MAEILIGNVKGPQGIPGETGATGAPGAAGADGAAATVNVGTVSTVAYGTPASVTNSGTEAAAVLDFVIPQGKPGEETTRMSGLTLDQITAQSATYPIPAVGESGATIWGKVVKFFTDIKNAVNTKLSGADCVTVLTSTETQKPLAASAGKALNDALTNKARIYKSLAELTNLSSLTLYQVLTKMEERSIFFGSVNTSQITNLKTAGELFLFRAPDNVIQKSLIVLTTATQSTTGIQIYIGFVRYDTHAVIWYTPTLTAS